MKKVLFFILSIFFVSNAFGMNRRLRKPDYIEGLTTEQIFQAFLIEKRASKRRETEVRIREFVERSIYNFCLRVKRNGTKEEKTLFNYIFREKFGILKKRNHLRLTNFLTRAVMSERCFGMPVMDLFYPEEDLDEVPKSKAFRAVSNDCDCYKERKEATELTLEMIFDIRKSVAKKYIELWIKDYLRRFRANNEKRKRLARKRPRPANRGGRRRFAPARPMNGGRQRRKRVARPLGRPGRSEVNREVNRRERLKEQEEKGRRRALIENARVLAAVQFGNNQQGRLRSHGANKRFAEANAANFNAHGNRGTNRSGQPRPPRPTTKPGQRRGGYRRPRRVGRNYEVGQTNFDHVQDPTLRKALYRSLEEY